MPAPNVSRDARQVLGVRIGLEILAHPAVEIFDTGVVAVMEIREFEPRINEVSPTRTEAERFK